MAYSFDGVNKLIILTSTSTLDLRDLWSRYTDWLAISDNSKYLQAMTTVGGDEIDSDAGTRIPIYIFLQNGWRIRPMESAHTLSVNNGILLVFGGGDPFVDTIGTFRVNIRYSQPVEAISFDIGNVIKPNQATSALSGVISRSSEIKGTVIDKNALESSVSVVDLNGVVSDNVLECILGAENLTGIANSADISGTLSDEVIS